MENIHTKNNNSYCNPPPPPKKKTLLGVRWTEKQKQRHWLTQKDNNVASYKNKEIQRIVINSYI
jgi:hypothetical protein